MGEWTRGQRGLPSSPQPHHKLAQDLIGPYNLISSILLHCQLNFNMNMEGHIQISVGRTTPTGCSSLEHELSLPHISGREVYRSPCSQSAQKQETTARSWEKFLSYSAPCGSDLALHPLVNIDHSEQGKDGLIPLIMCTGLHPGSEKTEGSGNDSQSHPLLRPLTSSHEHCTSSQWDKLL